MEGERQTDNSTYIEEYFNSSNKGIKNDKGDELVHYKLFKTSTEENINEIIDMHKKSSEEVHLSNHLLLQSMKRTRITRTKTADFADFNRYKIEKMLQAIKARVNDKQEEIVSKKIDNIEDQSYRSKKQDLTSFLESLETFLFNSDYESNIEEHLNEKESEIIWRIKRRILEIDNRKRKSEDRCQAFLNANTLNKFRFTKNMKEIQAEIDSFNIKEKKDQLESISKQKNPNRKEKELKELIHLADKQIELYEKHMG